MYVLCYNALVANGANFGLKILNPNGNRPKLCEEFTMICGVSLFLSYVHTPIRPLSM